MVRNPPAVAATVLLVAMILPLSGAPREQDFIELSVDRGRAADEITLSWFGGTPSYEIYRSPSAGAVGVPANWIGTTDQQEWVDSPPVAPVWFYHVVECPPCAPCGGATDVSAPGGRYDVMLTGSSDTGTCGGSGVEGALTFTLAVPSDVFVTTHQVGNLDTVLYLREGGCGGAEIARPRIWRP